jgi:hypothetical protein
MKNNKFINKKILLGGDQINNNTTYKNMVSINQIETFLSIIIIGYFGVKIVYSFFFNFYPQKYYNRNLSIKTNENKINNLDNTENITLNAYMPGIWNNEITDFITLIILSVIIFIYTHVSTKSFIDINGNLSLSFLFGYIIGLGYPPIYVNYIKLYSDQINSSDMIKYVYLSILIIFIIYIVILNYYTSLRITSSHKTSYMVYVLAIILIIFGSIYAKKNIKTYNSVTYFYNDDSQCTFSKKGIVQSSGDIINITLPFIVFVLLLFFSYEPEELSLKNIYTFIYGLLLGILVSSISYFGIEYFLIKQPEKICNSLSECTLKEIPTPIQTEESENEMNDIINDINIDSNIKNDWLNYNNTNNISIINSILIIIIILILIFLAYNYLKK